MPKNKLKKLADKWRFGFEIEGVFNQTLANKVMEFGEFKDDGSVSVGYKEDKFNAYHFQNETCNTCEGSGSYEEECQCERDVLNCNLPEAVGGHSHDDDCYVMPCEDNSDFHQGDCGECDGRGYFDNEDLAREFASQIFNKAKDMLKILGEFNNGKNYLMNKTCGLHLHLSNRNEDENQKLRAIVCNYQFMQGLYEQALTFCECQKNRLRNEASYCQFYDNASQMVWDYKTNEKYRFMRWHDHGTLEFRFFTPCEHKVKNVIKLLNLLKEYINGKEQIIKEVDVPNKRIDIAKTLPKVKVINNIAVVKNIEPFTIPYLRRGFVSSRYSYNPNDYVLSYGDSEPLPLIRQNTDELDRIIGETLQRELVNPSNNERS